VITVFGPDTKPLEGIFEMAVCPTGLALANDFRTIDWVREYPFPNIALKELHELLL
jgi:hypothetical protein